MVIMAKNTEVWETSTISPGDQNKPNNESIPLQEIVNNMKKKSISVVLLSIIDNIQDYISEVGLRPQAPLLRKGNKDREEGTAIFYYTNGRDKKQVSKEYCILYLSKPVSV